jgi:hypothetical protein
MPLLMLESMSFSLSEPWSSLVVEADQAGDVSSVCPQVANDYGVAHFYRGPSRNCFARAKSAQAVTQATSTLA